MDEELPLIIFISIKYFNFLKKFYKYIFIVLNTNCKNFLSSINMVSDYVNYYP